MLVHYDLLTVDEPMFGRIVFPRPVVEKALETVNEPTMYGKGILDLCRFEVPEWSMGQDMERDEMIGRLSDSGCLLEVIGHVDRVWLEGDVVKCKANMHENLRWGLPLEDHKPVPYMSITAKGTNPRIVTKFQFTEIVLVYQAVTQLALTKFKMRKINRLSC